MEREIALFPLHTVLFPGGPLALRVFEPRYLDMISRCLKVQCGFGVALIREGEEVGAAAVTHPLGTYGHIRYWEQRKDGLLGITFLGEQRFRVLETFVQADQLLTARVELLPAPAAVPLPERFRPLESLLRSIIDALDHPYVTLPRHYDDAAWVAGRLTELLPLRNGFKQQMLQIENPLDQLSEIQAAIAAGDL